MNDLTNMNCLI